jgi:hypothetical protein
MVNYHNRSLLPVCLYHITHSNTFLEPHSYYQWLLLAIQFFQDTVFIATDFTSRQVQLTHVGITARVSFSKVARRWWAICQAFRLKLVHLARRAMLTNRSHQHLCPHEL